MGARTITAHGTVLVNPLRFTPRWVGAIPP
jgi:hypothetical protein